jgi:glyoxylase-like metal-dependent hydrolase (beta-lactamase superfamily II)
MAEILPGVHMVEGVDPSKEFSTHVYLLRDTADQWVLIDRGLPGSEAAILDYARRVGIEPAKIRFILLTHLHRDHTGGLKAMSQATHARSYAHWIEADFIAGQPPYDGPGMPPAESVKVDQTILDGEKIDIAGGIVAYHTPGHTPGHTSYYLPAKKWLFSGDLFLGVPNLALTSPQFTQHTGTAQISARRVSRLAVDSLFTYHGGPFLTNAGAELQALVRGF